MQHFTYPCPTTPESSSPETINAQLEALAAYLIQEHKKGKLPLIVAGAGASAAHLSGEDGTQFETGLPCLDGMIKKIWELVSKQPIENSGEALNGLRKLFHEAGLAEQRPYDPTMMTRIDREWIGKLFGTLSENGEETVCKIWNQFCKWFFFECCSGGQDGACKGGALDIRTSHAALEIAKLYKSLDALCLSANFDDFLEFAINGIDGGAKGISLLSKADVDRYFRRNRRGKFPFEKSPRNRCVLHANGDVLWLHCSGNNDEGYCPNNDRYFPAFYNRAHTPKEEILTCPICDSRMQPTMTMPGTYQKDYNTRQILSSVWENIAPKISCVITVGLSCNWDDVLLKFILELLIERKIPLLDINSLSGGSSEIVRRIVKEQRFQSFCIRMDAKEGLNLLNKAVHERMGSDTVKVGVSHESAANSDMPEFYPELIKMLETYSEIDHLKHVSQLGLKAMSAKSQVENNRWEHSKEVAQIAYQLYRRLCKNSRKEEIPAEQALLIVAGLLHDCGHLPFSHLLEDVFAELSWGITTEGVSFKHSQYSRILIHQMCDDSDSPLKKFLDRYEIQPEDVVDLIEGNYGIGYLDTLINSAVDADKIAYIFTDAKQMERALMLEFDEFIERLTAQSYITQEGLVALDSASAWYAMRLLDERKRMYDELYLNPHMRCMEAAAKYIITTYFVQQYNRVEFSPIVMEHSSYPDLGGYRIMLASEDMIQMGNGQSTGDCSLSFSVGRTTKSGLQYCMRLIQSLSAADSESREEWILLKNMYRQLTGETWNSEKPRHPELIGPYQDDQLQDMAAQLSYQKLADLRKRIVLNYPGTVLIDLYKPIRYYATPAVRRRHYRMDGTNCAQDTILLPNSARSRWRNEICPAEISISEYAERYEKESDQRPIFQVFRISDNPTDCEHAVDVLKKEMQAQLRKGGAKK